METYSCIEVICGERLTTSLEYNVDALLAHGVNTATKELRTVKNENKDLKRDLIIQMTNSGEYDMPEAKSKKVSPIKEIIAAQISFINS